MGGVFFACQVIPYFSLSIFLPQVFKQLGMEDPYTSGIIFNLFLFLGVLLGTWLIDRISRRLFLTGSFYLCAAALLTMTVWQGIPTLWALICISTFSFIISAASVLEFVYPPELFSTELRGSGVGFCVACSRIGGAGGTFLLPIVMENFGTVAALFRVVWPRFCWAAWSANCGRPKPAKSGRGKRPHAHRGNIWNVSSFCRPWFCS